MSRIDGSSFRDEEPLLRLHMLLEVEQGDLDRRYNMSAESYGVA